jgi:outer membrane protein TolC
MRKSFLFICVIHFILVLPLCAQQPDDFILKSLTENDISNSLPSVTELMVLAEENSPLLKYYQSEVVITELRTKLEKSDWMKNFSFDSDLRYGIFDNLIINQALGLDANTVSSTKQTRYSFGVSMKMPLSAISNRKKSIQIAKNETEKAIFQRQAAIKELHDLIIVQYNNLLKSHRLMIISNQSREMFNIQSIQAEKEFINGMIPISEYARLQEMNSKAVENFENNKSSFLTAFMLLQETIGVKLNY